MTDEGVAKVCRLPSLGVSLLSVPVLGWGRVGFVMSLSLLGRSGRLESLILLSVCDLLIKDGPLHLLGSN